MLCFEKTIGLILMNKIVKLNDLAENILGAQFILNLSISPGLASV